MPIASSSSSSALLYQLDQVQLERSQYRNAPDIKQRLTECERELLEWKERALQAEARLANIEAAIRLPSLPPRRDTPETRAATAPRPFAQLPTPVEQSPREAEARKKEERESADRPVPSRNSQCAFPPPCPDVVLSAYPQTSYAARGSHLTRRSTNSGDRSNTNCIPPRTFRLCYTRVRVHCGTQPGYDFASRCRSSIRCRGR